VSPTARLYGGPKDGELLTLEESVPYELTLPVLVEVPKVEDGEAVVITGAVIYRRRGDYLEALTLDEPIPYNFVGPAKRGSRR
jgi:hypothetical protein